MQAQRHRCYCGSVKDKIMNKCPVIVKIRCKVIHGRLPNYTIKQYGGRRIDRGITKLMWVKALLILSISPIQNAPSPWTLFPLRHKTWRATFAWSDLANAQAPVALPEFPLRYNETSVVFTFSAIDRNSSPVAVTALPERCNIFSVELLSRLLASASTPASPISLKPTT